MINIVIAILHPMPRQLINILLLFMCLMLFIKCAQVVQLTGGEKDSEAPKLIQSLPENKSVNFVADQIILQFDEFIQLKDISNQIIINPPLPEIPEMEADGKKLKINLKKSKTEPNTTYRIFFGNAINDMHEGNVLKDFEFVFSTGSEIDTLKAKGEIEIEFDKSEPGECVVALYNTDKITNDSFAYQLKADYIVKSNKTGNFDFKYLPNKNFKALAFWDKNKNYLYDGESERIAFSDLTHNPSIDTTSIHLNMFAEKTGKLYLKKTYSPYYGKVQLIYSKEVISNIKPLHDSDQTKIYHHQQNKANDTLSVYYKNITDTLKLISTNPEFSILDTLIIGLPKFKPTIAKKLMFTQNWLAGVLEKNVKPRLQFYNLIDTGLAKNALLKIKYIKDTLKVTEDVELKVIDPITVELANNFAEGIDYKVVCDTAAFHDYTGKYNDSIKLNLSRRESSELGKLKLNLLLDKKQHYIIQLIGANHTVVMEKSVYLSLSSSNSVEVIMDELFPGTYRIKIIYDDNANKKWDTGNLLEKRQPEKIRIPAKEIKIMADWEVEEEIKIQ
ncbi:MAG: Ig-like domain-containing protein [Sphingobacteriaceae bacterium]|nr:Ig-like domain-containing protein [Sphingobacteriaceae bacterium]